MNLSKHLEFFDPRNDITCPITIIGCGAIGSTLAENLARLGIEKLTIYDFDTVSEHNITNQMFLPSQIDKPKTDSLIDLLKAINPNIEITSKGKYTNQRLTGYVFLCVDSITLRKEITEEQFNNPYIKAMFDFRMRLTDAQHYASDWSNPKTKANMLKTMQFSPEEAQEATPTSACGTSLSVTYTVRNIVALGVANFINFIKTENIKNIIVSDLEKMTLDVFPQED